MSDVESGKNGDDRSVGVIAPLSRGEIKDLSGVGVLALAWVSLPALFGFWLLAEIGGVSTWYAGWEEERGIVFAILLYLVLFAVTSGLGLLPTYAQAFLGGWIFGPVAGSIGALGGLTLGAGLGFALARCVSGVKIERLIDRRPVVKTVRDELLESGFLKTVGIVALLRLSPSSPFAFSNLALGGARTPALPMLLGTFLGMAPRTIVVVAMAAAAAADGSQDLVDVVTRRSTGTILVGLVVLVGSLWIIGHIAKRAMRRAIPSVGGDA